MRHYTEALAIIPNQRLIENRNQTLRRQPTFGSLGSDSGEMFMGVAQTSGENRASGADEQALASPLLEKRSIRGAKSIPVRFVVGFDKK